MPAILIAIAVAIFFTFTQVIYSDVNKLRADVASYDEALNNSKALENERDKLTQKYNSIGGENLDKLKKLLPENVDNIRLILEIEKIAGPYGMTLKDVKYSTKDKTKGQAAQGEIQGGTTAGTPKDYGIWELQFATTGTYANFLNFIKDLEKNLRIVDVTAVEFSSDVSSLGVAPLSQPYQYRFTIKTYWLKN
jgi:hypothetical protein